MLLDFSNMIKATSFFLLLSFFTLDTTRSFADSNFLVLAKVSVDEAARKVADDKKSRVLGAKTEVIEGREVHVIKTLSDEGRVQNEKVDAETGKPLDNKK
jgi:hypothetical protein